MKIGVLGAGVSGLTIGRLLQERGCEVILFEKNATAGGLARSRFTNGLLYDPHGGHILNSKHPEVMDWVFSILPKENWQYTGRNAKIFFRGKYISYPFELSLCELDTDDAVDCVYDFILAQKGEEPSDFREWLVWNFGEGIAERYMIPYNEKIWAYPLEDMETQWMQGKMPLPTKKEMIRSMLLKDPSERKMPHSSFYYPLRGGIQTMVDAIADGMDIRYNTNITKISKRDRKWVINEEEEVDQVVSTIPLPLLPAVMELPSEIVQSICRLKYNSLSTVLFECPKTDITWLYIPSHAYKSHRVGYQSTLTPYGCPISDRSCGALEIIGKPIEDPEALAHRHDILPEELGYTETLDYEFTEYAYVIHDRKYRDSITAVKAYFSENDSFHLLGRWGTWNYKNMDLCMADAMQLVRELTL